MKKYPFAMSSILLSPDAAEGVDPLDTNVNDVDTSYPLIPATYYVMKIDSAKVEPNKKGTGDNILVSFKTTERCQDIKGNDVPAGLAIRQYISITETPQYDVNSIKRSVASLAQAAGVSATVREIINNPATLEGKLVRVKVKVNKETSEYSASNGIAGYAPLNA